MDYGKLGLRVGLEVHQELDTEHKMFCACPPKLFREDPEYTFVRRLRPSQSELGEIDLPPSSSFYGERPSSTRPTGRPPASWRWTRSRRGR